KPAEPGAELSRLRWRAARALSEARPRQLRALHERHRRPEMGRQNRLRAHELSRGGTMTRRNTGSHPGDGKQFTALAEFARGYLHEDVIEEYGSAAGAASAFCADASADECRALADD